MSTLILIAIKHSTFEIPLPRISHRPTTAAAPDYQACCQGPQIDISKNYHYHFHSFAWVCVWTKLTNWQSKGWRKADDPNEEAVFVLTDD